MGLARSGAARPGEAWRAGAWRGETSLGHAWSRHGMTWHGCTGLGQSRPRGARRGKTWPDVASLSRPGPAWLGMIGRCLAWPVPGPARLVEAQRGFPTRRTVWPGLARHGTAGHGGAWLGWAGPDWASLLSTWLGLSGPREAGRVRTRRVPAGLPYRSVACPGWAGPSWAEHGYAGQGFPSQRRGTGLDVSWHGPTRLVAAETRLPFSTGAAARAPAGHGGAWHGKAWRASPTAAWRGGARHGGARRGPGAARHDFPSAHTRADTGTPQHPGALAGKKGACREGHAHR